MEQYYPSQSVEYDACPPEYVEDPRAEHYRTSYQRMNTVMSSRAPAPGQFVEIVNTYERPELADVLTQETLHAQHIPPQEKVPREYRYLPPGWTGRIPQAGKLSFKGPSAKNVIFYDSYGV
jgi:hypothetical protein